MADIVEKSEETTMEVAEAPTQNENAPAECKKEEVEASPAAVDEEGGDEHDEVEEQMDETEEVEKKPAEGEKAEEAASKEAVAVSPFSVTNFYKNAAAVDIGKCMLMTGLPSSLYDDDAEIFNDCIVSMLEEDFTVKKDAIESITRLAKGEDEENGCRVMVSFKSRVHKHRVMAVKNRANVGCTLEQVEEVPTEVVELLKEVKKVEEEEKKEEEKKEFEKYVDEHSTLPFVINWEGAPEFQWKIPEGKGTAVNLVIENAEVLDLYEPFLYRASLKAQSVMTKVPGRIIDDQPTAKHFGTITLQYLTDSESIKNAMVNLIYFRSQGDRRIKVYLPQTTVALKRKTEFEKRLGRKIEYTEDMKKVMVKSTDVSLSECTFGLEEAKAAFPLREVEAVERVTDVNEKVAFVVTFKSAHEAVLAHANAKSIKMGEILCRLYMVGVEVYSATSSRKGRGWLTRLEMIAATKEEQAKKKAEHDEKVARGEIVVPPKKTFPKKPVGAAPLKKRGGAPLSPSKGIPINKSNGPSFKQPFSSTRGGRGAYVPRSTPYNNSRTGASPTSRGPPTRTRRDDGPIRSSRPSPWMENGGRRSGGQMSSSAFNQDDLRMEQMVREQRRQMEMQEQLLRQQEMINVMSDRLSQPALSSSAFRQRDYELSAPTTSSYGVSPVVAYNKASGYTPSPAYEPLTSTMTPSHLSNPSTDKYRSSSAFTSPQYGKPASSSYTSSSSYSDRRY